MATLRLCSELRSNSATFCGFLLDGLFLGLQTPSLCLHRGEFLLVVGFELLTCGELLRRLGQLG